MSPKFSLIEDLMLVKSNWSPKSGFISPRLKLNAASVLTFTFLGSLIWSYPLVYVGMKLGEHTEKLKAIWHKFDLAIVIVLGVLFILYLKHHFDNLKES